MSPKVFFIATLLLVSLTTINGLAFNCNFAVRNRWAGQNINVYSCSAEVLFLGDERNLTEVSNNHLDGRNNSDVKLLWMQNQAALTVFPRNIYQFFPNLEGIEIYTTPIAELTGEDLRGLHQLRALDFVTGKIFEIGSETFKDNPLIDRIAMRYQLIRHIGHRVFDYLPNLTILHVDIPCFVNTNAQNRVAVLNLIAQIFRSCPPSFRMTLDDILKSSEFNERVEQEVALQNYPFRNKMLETERKVERLEARVELLERQVSP